MALHFRGPDVERLVAGRERILLDRFYDDLSFDPAGIDEATREHYVVLYAQPHAIHDAFKQFAAFNQDAKDNQAFVAQATLLKWIKPGGRLISIVSEPDRGLAERLQVNADFMLARVDRPALDLIAQLFDGNVLRARVGLVLPLEEARTTHRMLDRLLPQPNGKIELQTGN